MFPAFYCYNAGYNFSGKNDFRLNSGSPEQPPLRFPDSVQAFQFFSVFSAVTFTIFLFGLTVSFTGALSD